jgi:uncharacterized protein YjbI with pentapeptide repeats
MQVVMNSIKFNPLFGVTLYNVLTYKATLQEAKLKNINLTNSIFLGVRYDSILFLTPSMKDRTKEVPLEQVTDIQVYP